MAHYHLALVALVAMAYFPVDARSHGSLEDILKSDQPIPDEFDWRTVPNRVSSVKDQGSCAAGWAFAVVGALEGAEWKKNISQLVELSAQNILDCVRGSSCGSEQTEYSQIYQYAYGYVRDKGIKSEEQYSYAGEKQTCKHETSWIAFQISTYDGLAPGDEEGLKRVVATVGPVAAAFDAHSQDFINYKQGVYVDHSCSSKSAKLNHGVLIVGYGHDNESGLDYWLVKNSWGTKWGEQGYFKVARNQGNMCGIATHSLYPVPV